MAGECGTCTACCRVFAIPPLNKPAGTWCQHCTIGKGCNIYDERPPACIDFECLWLQSQAQKGAAKLGPELRPDKCRIVISPTTNPNVLSFIPMPGYELAWRKKGPVRDLLVKLVNAGIRCAIGQPRARQCIEFSRDPDTGKLVEKEVRMTAPDKDGMQWSE